MEENQTNYLDISQWSQRDIAIYLSGRKEGKISGLLIGTITGICISYLAKEISKSNIIKNKDSKEES